MSDLGKGNALTNETDSKLIPGWIPKRKILQDLGIGGMSDAIQV
jgi:hypothetical protein